MQSNSKSKIMSISDLDEKISMYYCWSYRGLIYKTLRKTLPKTLRSPKPQNPRTHKNIQIFKTVQRTTLHTRVVINTNVLWSLRHAPPKIVPKQSLKGQRKLIKEYS